MESKEKTNLTSQVYNSYSGKPYNLYYKSTISRVVSTQNIVKLFFIYYLIDLSFLTQSSLLDSGN